MKYPREFPVALYHHNLGASIDEALDLYWAISDVLVATYYRKFVISASVF